MCVCMSAGDWICACVVVAVIAVAQGAVSSSDAESLAAVEVDGDPGEKG